MKSRSIFGPGDLASQEMDTKNRIVGGASSDFDTLGEIEQKFKELEDNGYDDTVVKQDIAQNKADITGLGVKVNELEGDVADASTLANSVQSQLDNLVLNNSGSSDVAPEVIQARTGLDGTTHTTLKARLDADQATLKTDISTVSEKADSYIKEQRTNIITSSEIDFVNNDKIVNTNNGELTDKSGTSTSDFIDLDNVAIYRIEASSKKTLSSFAFYDKNKVFISGQTTTTNYETTDYNGKVVFDYVKTKPQNAKYIRISKQNSITSVSYHIDVTEDYYIFNGITSNDNSPQAVVTFIDDDFRNDSLVNWEEIADATGIKPVFAVRTNKVGLTQDSPTWDEIDRTRNKGFEYLSHTHNHIYLNEETDETIIEDFKATITALDAHKCTSDVLVYPGGRINAHVKELTKRYFKCGVTVGLKLQTLPLDDYQINRVSFIADERETITVDGTDYSVYRILSLDELKAIVDDAIDRGGWLIFMSHFRNTLTDGYYFNDEIKERVIELIKYIASKNIRIATFSEGYEKMKNVVSCGTLSDEAHYIVDCNGQVYQ